MLEEMHMVKLTGAEIAFRALGDAGYTSGPDLLGSPEASGLTRDKNCACSCLVTCTSARNIWQVQPGQENLRISCLNRC